MEKQSVIAGHYLKVIKAFKNRYDVQNGFALAYRPGQNPDNTPSFQNIPKTIGQALTTTGWCVSVSQALLLDKVFQTLLISRNAFAKLISIDIKEQYYGATYAGNQNKWHTAILVKDSNNLLVIDMTCAQFGNPFVEKFIWDFETWEKTFRSPLDLHKITDFDGNEVNFLPLNKVKPTPEVTKAEAESLMHDLTTLTDGERKLLVKFFFEDIFNINKKLYLGNVNKFDFQYIGTVNRLLQEFEFVNDDESLYYHVMEFNSKSAASDWVKKFLKNDGITSEYLLFSKCINDFCDYASIKSEDINKEISKKYFVIIKLNNFKGCKINFIKNIDGLLPFGIKLEFDKNNDIYNGGKDLKVDEQIEIKTNTIYINANL